jgi:hypothetical protein
MNCCPCNIPWRRKGFRRIILYSVEYLEQLSVLTTVLNSFDLWAHIWTWRVVCLAMWNPFRRAWWSSDCKYVDIVFDSHSNRSGSEASSHVYRSFCCCFYASQNIGYSCCINPQVVSKVTFLFLLMFVFFFSLCKIHASVSYTYTLTISRVRPLCVSQFFNRNCMHISSDQCDVAGSCLCLVYGWDIVRETENNGATGRIPAFSAIIRTRDLHIQMRGGVLTVTQQRNKDTRRMSIIFRV